MMGPNFNNCAPMPGRVTAAFTYLGYCESVTHQCDPSVARYELTATEQSVKSAALEVLRLYLHGEMDFGDAPPTRPPGDGEDDAGRPAPVKV